MKLQSYIFLLTIFIIEILLIVPSVHATTNNTAKNGMYSIQDFPKKTFMQLDGEWEFYWHQLYTPNDFKRNTVSTEPQMIQIPESSDGYTLGNGEQVNTGYATYRLHIQFPKEEVGTIKALYMPSIASAYTLWIDGAIKASNGKVGTSKHSMIPENARKVVLFQVHSTSMEIVIQNSNYNQRKAGIFSSILIGNPDIISQYREKNFIFRTVMVASLIMIGLYHFVLFAFRKKENAPLFFGCLCFMIALRTILLEEGLAAYFLPFLSWEVASKVEYLGATLGGLFLSLFTYSQFSSDMSRKIRSIIIFIATIYSFFILLAPVLVSTKAMELMQAIIVVIFLYLIYVYVKVFIKKRKGAVLNAIGAFALFITVLNDILKYNDLIHTPELTSVGLVFHLFMQSIIISKNYSLAFDSNDRLAKDLSILNASLEEKVQKRTEELHQSNNQLLVVNQKLNETHLSKSKLISNISHEIGSPLTIIRSYTKGMIDGIIVNNREYMELVYEKSIYLSKILEDLVALSDLDNQQITFNLERIDSRQFSQKLFEKYKLILARQQVVFEYKDSLSHQEHTPFVLIDEIRIEQVVVNLLTNAQRFVGENGKIILELAKKDTDHILIKIIDNGIGLNEEETHLVFERFYSNRKQGKQHNGAGLGLAISKEIIEHHKGKIWATSKNDEGTCFCFSLPIIKN